jgi:hypothetical protein
MTTETQPQRGFYKWVVSPNELCFFESYDQDKKVWRVHEQGRASYNVHSSNSQHYIRLSEDEARQRATELRSKASWIDERLSNQTTSLAPETQ